MHILPLILATWSYKQRVEEAIEERARNLSGARERWRHLDYKPNDSEPLGLIISQSKTTALNRLELDSVRYDRVADPIDYSKPNHTNEIDGSHFMTTTLCHVGTDAWGSLKNRLAENGIRINDEDVAIMAAGFHAERKLQEILGQTDKQALRDELEGNFYNPETMYSAKWVREINAHPNAEAIALECFEDLNLNYPAALGVDMREAQGAIGFDPNVIDVDAQ